jgi:DNA mismatch repair ATPase MutS
LKDPVPNSAELKRSVVSGSNASGKSTFIKSAAVNGIFAQTIHTCTAKSYVTRPALVMTSMAVRDDITKKESYFITEIKSLRRIIENIPRVFCACYIDEILKGTNTIERIAASAAVLKFLEGLDCVCVVATHDIELTRMLPGYVNFHFGEQITGSGVEFDYKIKQGPSTTKNAIKLLDFMEFDRKIIEGAEKLVGKFEKTQTWDKP